MRRWDSFYLLLFVYIFTILYIYLSLLISSVPHTTDAPIVIMSTKSRKSSKKKKEEEGYRKRCPCGSTACHNALKARPSQRIGYFNLRFKDKSTFLKYKSKVKPFLKRMCSHRDQKWVDDQFARLDLGSADGEGVKGSTFVLHHIRSDYLEPRKKIESPIDIPEGFKIKKGHDTFVVSTKSPTEIIILVVIASSRRRCSPSSSSLPSLPLLI